MIDALVVTKGHSFDEVLFQSFLHSFSDIRFTRAQHPDALMYFAKEWAEKFSVFVFYDMPGIVFKGQQAIEREPPESFKANFEALLKRGKGLVFLHHAVAAWPSWPEYGDVIGAHFLYKPSSRGARITPDSGYRRNVTHTIERVNNEHPLAAGLPASFELCDEPYLMHVDEAALTPVFRSNYVFTDQNFFSAANAISGKRDSRENWRHDEGSSLVAWTRQVEASRIVYIQPGDGRGAYENPHYRRLVLNAIQWAADN